MPPVVAAVGAVVSSVGFAATGALMAVGLSAGASMAVVGALGQLAIGVSLTAMQRAIASNNMPDAPQMGVRLTPTTSEGASETIILGKYATPGDHLYTNSYGEQLVSAPNAFLVQVYELGGWPMDLNRVFINGEWCDLGPEITSGPRRGRPVLQYNVKNRDYMWVKYYDGTQTTPDPYLRDKFGSDPEQPWTGDMIGRGIPYVIVTSRVKEGLHRGAPKCLFEVGGARVYNPAKDSSRGGSGSQRLGQPSTWRSTNNPAVMTWNILYGIRDLDQTIVYGVQVAAEDMLTDSWIAAINECDVLIGGSPQYRCGIEIPIAEMQPLDAIEAIQNSFQGEIAEVGGYWMVRAGPPAMSVFSFTDNDVIISQGTEFDPFPGLDQVPTGVSGTYYEPDTGWTQKSAPLRGKAGNVTALDFPTVWDRGQAQRLMASAFETSKRFRRHVIVLPPEARRLSPLDTIQWTSFENSYTSKAFSVTMTKDLPDGNVAVALLEVDPDDYNIPDLLPTDIGFTSRPTSVLGGVLNFAVSPILVRGSNGQKRAGIRLTWNKNIDFVTHLRWQVRLAGEPETFPGQGTVDNPEPVDGTRVLNRGGETLVKNAEPLIAGVVADITDGYADITDGILSLTNYEVRARYEPNAGIWDWSDWLPVTTDDARIQLEDLDPSLADLLANAEQAALDAVAAVIGDIDLADEKLDLLEQQIADAQTSLDAKIETVRLTTAGKTRTFQQAATPFATAVGDGWRRSTDGKWFIATALGQSGWVESTDPRVIANVAAIENETIVRQNAVTSLAAQINTVSASLAGTSASVTQLSAAVVALQGASSVASIVWRLKAGGVTGELELVASNDVENGPAIIGKFNGNFIIDGTLSSRALVVTDASGNLVADASIQDEDYWDIFSNQSSWTVIKTTSRGSDAPSKGELRYNGPYAWIRGQAFIVSAGDRFKVSGYFSSLSSSNFHGYLSIRWHDKTGDYIGQTTKSFVRAATSPLLHEFDAVAPTGAMTAHWAVVPHSASAAGRWWAPSVRRQSDAQTLILPGSITSGLLIGTEAVLTKEVQAGVATIGNAAIRNLAVTNAKIANAAITTAKIGDLQVDRLKIGNNAAGTWSFLNSTRGVRTGSNQIRFLMEAPGDIMCRCDTSTLLTGLDSNDAVKFDFNYTEGFLFGQGVTNIWSGGQCEGFKSQLILRSTPSTFFPSYMTVRFDFDFGYGSGGPGTVNMFVNISVFRRYK